VNATAPGVPTSPIRLEKIALTTGGGDAPGLNAVIRAATLAAIERGIEIWGIERGYGGLLDEGAVVRLDRSRVRGIMHLGGTILGAQNRGSPFRYPTLLPGASEKTAVDRSDEVIRRFRELGFDALVAIGGDGSLWIANQLERRGIGVVMGVPKTIDNDVRGTDLTFGFDTAVSIASEAIDRLHTTAEAHERVFVVEVMGRNAGWIALRAGLAGGADVILLPEIPFQYESILAKIREREARGRRFSIIVAAEGATPAGEVRVMKEAATALSPAGTLGGIAELVAHELASRSGKETRALVLGHLQRGGGPTTYDRQLALRFGSAAIRFLAEGRGSGMVALAAERVVHVPLEEPASGIRTVPLDADSLRAAREMGISLGD
jgi:ATP-dependent phosphofructokinase / diphosphate-dependent phosphofructokinase